MGKALRIFVFVAVSIWVIYLFFYRIGSAPFENWDEAFYADGIRYMFRHHQYFIPYWNGAPFFDKPPLYHWLGVISVWLFGLNEFAIRLPSVTAAIGTVALSGYYVFRKYGKLAALATIFALISNPLYIYRSRGANLDALATFWIVVSFVILQSSVRRRTFYFGLIVGLVFLTKASLAYYLMPIFFVDTVSRNIHLIRSKKSRLTCLIMMARQCFNCAIGAAILPLIWLFGAYQDQGWQFINYFLFSSDQGVARLSFSQLSPVYLGYIKDSVGVWFGIVAFMGYIFMAKNIRKHLNEILYGIFLLCLLVLSTVYSNWYLMPMFPFAAIAVGFAVKTFRDQYLKHLHRHYAVLFPILVGLLLFFQYSRMHRRIIRDILESQTTIYQSQSAEYAKRITRVDEYVVRLDDLYPTAVYYADRPIRVSMTGTAKRNEMYMTREDLYTRLKNKNARVFIGKTGEVTSVIKNVGSGRIDFTSGDESVGVFTP
ncbi:MAG: glycosyltransferase family 39 protein [Candidatus Roizmanbacteria bacterium]